MDRTEYLKRVQSEIDWYNANASRNKRRYTSTKIALTVTAAVIPVLTAYTQYEAAKVAIALLSIATGVLANVTTIFKYRDNWVQYRKMCELLQSELFLYAMGAGAYKGLAQADRDTLFADTCEAYMRNENLQWVSAVSDAKDAKPSATASQDVPVADLAAQPG